jgi:hypothetical protein
MVPHICSNLQSAAGLVTAVLAVFEELQNSRLVLHAFVLCRVLDEHIGVPFDTLLMLH